MQMFVLYLSYDHIFSALDNKDALMHLLVKDSNYHLNLILMHIWRIGQCMRSANHSHLYDCNKAS